MNVLVIGSGGREHALTWKLHQSPRVEKIFCAPGNPGMAEFGELVPIKADDPTSLLKFAKSNKIDLTVVGPELPLSLGIVDLFERDGMRIFGPTKLAAEIESSKVFAKQFMKKYRIPTADFRAFQSAERYEAERYINEVPAPVVIKANGLAGGKGAVVCETKDKALEVLHEMLVEKVFGEAGEQIVIEEFMIGQEASVFAISDGTHFVTLPPAQDHKRILDGERGKNTGGMGAYAPTPFVTEELLETIKRSIIRPAISGLAKEGRKYKGCLYCGLMLTKNGPRVVEFNCRFGDPETQVVLPLLGGDFFDLLLTACNASLQNYRVKLRQGTAVCVVIASGGYPDTYQTGKEILGLESLSTLEDIVVFHAGTRVDHGRIVTDGGRVVGVTAIGSSGDLEQTIARAYQAVSKITFDGAYYRSDIGAKALSVEEPV
jgi:phosphoribosylamine--glycine ligase